MRKRTYQYISDPAHGWLKVSVSEMESLGLLERVSCCSYLRGGYAYLEEDDDATEFINALREKGITVEIKESHSNKMSRIRGYKSYSPVAARAAIKAVESKAKEVGDYAVYVSVKGKLLELKDNLTVGQRNYWIGRFKSRYFGFESSIKGAVIRTGKRDGVLKEVGHLAR